MQIEQAQQRRARARAGAATTASATGATAIGGTCLITLIQTDITTADRSARDYESVTQRRQYHSTIRSKA